MMRRLEVTSMNWWSATVNVVVVQHVLTERCKGVSVYPLRCTKQLTKGGQCAHLFQYPGACLLFLFGWPGFPLLG